MSRYLVTGGTGFLGAHLVPLLAERGHEVVALARRAPETTPPARVTVRLGDVLDAGSVRDAAAGCDGVFHCAGKVSRRPEDAEALYRVHVEGTKIALDACREAGVRRADDASTSGVVAVSREEQVIDERAPAPVDLLARWPYYRSKLYAEKAALDRNDPPRFEVVCINPTLLLGPGDLRDASTGDVVQFLEKKVPFVPAGGLSFVDVRDTADAALAAMERGRAGERYLLAAANMTIEAFFGRLSRVSGVPAPRLRLPKSVALAAAGAALLKRAAKHVPIEAPVDRVSAEMAQHFWYVDATKAKTELGFSPRDPMETLADTVNDLRARGVVWPA
ncbi:MAG TPA: NAD-dependent epimerase/dehydratase family protein [Minicystis sp.]|nr:NAD-dependent epimerase/dehydratase family protein [Minicystis sp.]